MASNVLALPAVGPLLGAAFDRAFVIFISRWRLLLVVAAAVLAAGFLNVLLPLVVLFVFMIYWLFASLANTGRLSNPAYKMSSEEATRIIGVGIIYGICVELGLLLLIVPGVYLAVKWSLAQLIVVRESAGAMDSLARSWALTQQAFWGTMWFSVLASLAVGVVSTGGYLISATATSLLLNIPHAGMTDKWNGGGVTGIIMSGYCMICVCAIAYTYQAKDIALLYWYNGLVTRHASEAA